MAAHVPFATSQPCPCTQGGPGTENNPELQGALSTSHTGWEARASSHREHPGGPVWGWGDWLDPEPPGVAERRRKPGGSGSSSGSCGDLCRTGHPAPRFDVISGRAELGAPPPAAPGPPPHPRPVPNLATGRAADRGRRTTRRPCKAIAAGRARGGHAHECAHRDERQQPRTAGTRKQPHCGCSPGHPPVHPWGVPTAAASLRWAHLRV